MTSDCESHLVDTPIFVVLYDIWHRRGGLTRNAIHKAMLIGDRLKRPTMMMTLDFNPDLAFSVQQLTKIGLLGDAVRVRNIFDDAGLYGGEPTAFFSKTLPVKTLPSLPCGPDQCGRLDVDATASRDETRDADGRLTVSYRNEAGAQIVREFYDMSGRRRSSECIDPETGSVIHRRFLDEEGTCRVEFIKMNTPSASWAIAVRDRSGELTRTFSSQFGMRRDWLDSYARNHTDSIFQVETETPLIVKSVLAMKTAGVAKVHMMHSSHLDSPHTLGSPIMPSHAAILDDLDRFDAFVLITESHRKDIELQYGPRPILHAVPHDGVPSSHELTEDRNPLLAVGVGRFTKRKNWDHVIRAFETVVARIPDARFELWGMGELEDDYLSLISELGLSNNVRLMGMSDDVPAVFRSASFSVLAGIREGFPLVLLESMAEGTAAIAYDGKYGPADIVRHNVDGLLVSYGDETALGEAFVSLFEDPQKARALGRAAIEISDRFSSDKCVNGWLKVYEAALEQRNCRVALPRITCVATRIESSRNAQKVSAEIKLASAIDIEQVSLQLRPRDSIADACFLPVTLSHMSSRRLQIQCEFSSSVFVGFPRVWDAYISISKRNAHRFVRVRVDAENVFSHSKTWSPYSTKKSGLSWKPTRNRTSAATRVRRTLRRIPKPVRTAVNRLQSIQRMREILTLIQCVRHENEYSPKIRTGAQFAHYYKRLRLRPKTVIFEATLDDTIRCNPGALFMQMLNDPYFKHFTLAWAIKNDSTREKLEELYRSDPRVLFVKRDSRAHMRLLASAKYIVTNGTLPYYFQRKSEQTILNTWHGVPIKKMGYEIPNGRVEARNVLRVLSQTDYLLSGSEYETQALYLRAHKLQGIFEGAVLEMGHPRVDITLSEDRSGHVAWLREQGVSVDPSKKIVLYAPTWRGERVQRPTDTTDEIFSFVEQLQSRLGSEEYTILLKMHQITATLLAGDERFRGILVPTHLDTNRVLGATDILVTDYSSIFVDYLVTERPIVFYINDLDEYVRQRGVYILPADLPGPVAGSASVVADEIARVEESKGIYASRYSQMLAQLCPHEDGRASERVIDTVFRNRNSESIRSGFSGEKKRILLYVGGFRRGHITRSILALLKRIDPERFDVSIIAKYAPDGGKRANFDRIPENVRPFIRVGTANITPLERFALEYFTSFGTQRLLWMSTYPSKLFKRGWTRVLGLCRFDLSIDLAGTSPFFAALLAEGRSNRTILINRSDISKRELHKHVIVKSISHRFDHVLTSREAPFSRLIDPCLINEDAEAYPVREVEGVLFVKARGQSSRLPECREKTFVTTAAQFEDQALLLEAFVHIHERHPDARLYFLAPRKATRPLAGIIEENKLADVVLIENPRIRLAFIKYCGCFLYPNLNDAPTANLLEAAALGMPTLIGKGTPETEWPFGIDRLIENSTAAFTQSMLEFLEGTLDQAPVDFETQNQRSMNEFYRLCDKA